jgi:hypothetical protein
MEKACYRDKFGRMFLLRRTYRASTTFVEHDAPSAARRDKRLAHGNAVGRQEKKKKSAVGAAQDFNRIRIADESAFAGPWC